MMIKAIIFDLQGTLVENGVFPSPLRQIKNILRIDAPFTDFVSRLEHSLMVSEHTSLRDAFARVCEDFGITPKDYIIDKLVGMWNKNKLLSHLYSDTLQALEQLKDKYTLVLVSDIDCFSKDILDKNDLRAYFNHVILSCEVGMLKGDKDFYSQILRKLGLSPQEVLMIGDSIESDIQAAKNCGINGVLIDRNNRREFDPKITGFMQVEEYIQGLGGGE